MKRILLLLPLLILFLNRLQSQSQWEFLNPKPSGFTGVDVHFVSKDTGFIVNNYELLITTDCGSSWNRKMNISSSSDISFFKSVGFIVGKNGYVLKTNNKGLDWDSIYIGTIENLNTINLINEDTIILSSSKNIFKSFDGGNKWEVVSIGSYIIVKSYFRNSKVGFAACNKGYLLKTIDGGLNWYLTYTTSLYPSDFIAIDFIDKNVGYASFESGFLRTEDGGETWVKLKYKIRTVLYIHFCDSLIGYISDGKIYKTIDGGKTWNLSLDLVNEIYSIYFIDQNVGFAIGLNGIITKTIDGGVTWNSYSSFYYDILEVSFTSNNVGYCLTRFALYKTINGGIDWQLVETGTNNGTFTDIDFFNDSVGIGIIGTLIYKTIDGGKSWKVNDIRDFVLSYELSTVEFLNSDTVYISSGNSLGGIIKTMNGGNLWKIINDNKFREIQFINSNVGYALDILYSKVYKTTDRGDTWSVVFEENSIDDILDIHFVDESLGFIVGDYGLYYKTIDGGLNWKKIVINSSIDFKAINFFDHKIGYISGEDSYVVRIYKTLDGGETWNMESIPYISNPDGLRSIAITENRKVFVSGNNGVILHDSISSDGFDLIRSVSNNRNDIIFYPNPFTEYIRFDGVERYPIVIEIFDISNKSVFKKELNNPFIDLSYLNKGFYIIKIDCKENVYIKKVIKN